MPDLAAITTDLAQRLSRDALVIDPTELPAYGNDFWGQRGTPGVVVRATCTEDVTETLRYAAARGIAVVPRGAGTNIGAGFLPTSTSIMLDLRKLNRVLHIDVERGEALVEPGVLNGALQAQLEPLGLRYSPDPASAPISTIGGNIAENAGGPRCLKYGVTFHHVAGIECVLAGGEILRLDASDAGPDLLGVVIGSEGTLGVVLQARLKLSPLPQLTRTLFATFDRPETAGMAVSAILATGILPATIEYLDQRAIHLFESYAPTGYPPNVTALLIDIDGQAEQVEHDIAVVEKVVQGIARKVHRAHTEAERVALWRGRLQAGQALAANGQQYIICDTTVPRSRIPDMQYAMQKIGERHGFASLLMIGHAGDGNVHPVILYDGADPLAVERAHAATSELTSAALELAGTITGEHGVGSEKLPFMRRQFSATEVAAMRAVKRVFDPGEILNPGILLPEPASDEPALPQLTAALQTVLAARRSGRLLEVPGTSHARTTQISEVSANALALDRENFTVVVSVDMPLRRLQDELVQMGYTCPLLQQIAEHDNATTVRDAFSLEQYRLPLRDALLEVDATLADGLPVHFGRSVIKDVAGYDMKRLFIGSSSMFGCVEQARFQVRIRA